MIPATHWGERVSEVTRRGKATSTRPSPRPETVEAPHSFQKRSPRGRTPKEWVAMLSRSAAFATLLRNFVCLRKKIELRSVGTLKFGSDRSDSSCEGRSPLRLPTECGERIRK